MHKLYTGMYSYIVLWVGNGSENRRVFKCLRNTPSVPAEVMFCAKLFHTARWSSNCEGLGANGGQFAWWCHETVGGSRAQGSSTGQVSNAKVCGSSSLKHFVHQHGYFELDALFDA